MMDNETDIQAVLAVFKDWGNLSNMYDPDPWTEEELRELAIDIIYAVEASN